ncbi:MAG: hypothetical protein NW206_07395 [Hyphomonadaceae bacterium]|nr:hypothetical protein [Hyphomonadaceae bacterium]
MHLPNDPDPAPTPLALWRVLRHYIVSLFSLFGDPLALARRVWITRDEARTIADALRPLEMMLRRLVFLDALELAPAPARARAPAKARQRTRRDTYNLETTESWRPSFDLRLRGASAPRRDAPVTPRPRLPNAELTRPLALRYEAMLRGFNEPAPLVQRMARLLARDRARQYKLLAGVRKRDAAKPFFQDAAHAITLARDHFQAWLMRQLDRPKADSS